MCSVTYVFIFGILNFFVGCLNCISNVNPRGYPGLLDSLVSGLQSKLYVRFNAISDLIYFLLVYYYVC